RTRFCFAGPPPSSRTSIPSPTIWIPGRWPRPWRRSPTRRRFSWCTCSVCLRTWTRSGGCVRSGASPSWKTARRPTGPVTARASGEGGGVVSGSEAVHEVVRRFLHPARRDRYVHTELGHDFPLTDRQPALGRVQQGRLGGWNARGPANARYLNEAFAGLDWLTT